MFAVKEILWYDDIESYKELRKITSLKFIPDKMTDFQKEVFLAFKDVKYDDAKLKAELGKKQAAYQTLAQFSGPYNHLVVERMLALLKDPQAWSFPQEFKLLLVAAALQLFVAVKFRKEPLNGSDVALFLQAVKLGCDPRVKGARRYALFIFTLLMTQLSNLACTDECRGHVIEIFKNKDAMTIDFYPLLETFIAKLVDSDPGYWKDAIDLSFSVIREEAPIVKGQEIVLFEKLEILDALLFSDDDRGAVMLVAAVSGKLDGEQRERFWEIIQQNYWSRVKYDMKIADPERVHDLPAVYTEPVPSEDVKMIDSKQKCEFRGLPPELSFSMDVFSKEISETMLNRNRMITDFLEILRPDQKGLFIRELGGSILKFEKSERASLLFSFLNLIDMLPGSAVLDDTKNLDVILDEVMFDPTRTFFGPNTLDQKVNQYRGAVVDVVIRHSPKCMDSIVSRQKGRCFLLAELAARLCLHSDFDFGILGGSSTVRMLSDTLVALRAMESDFAPRMAIFILFFSYLKCTFNGHALLSESYFVNSFLRFLYERGMTDVILQALRDSFANSQAKRDTESVHILNDTKHYLMTFTERAPEMLVKVSSLVTETVAINPDLGVEFVTFLDMFMQQLRQKSGPTEFENATTLLLAVSAADPSFELSIEYLQILSQVLTKEHYTLLLNLAGGSFSVSNSKLTYFLIRRPSYLPLFFVALGKDKDAMNDFLDYTKRLVIDKSDYNVYRLHDGGVDSILLKWLKSGPKITHRGVDIEFQATKSLVLEVLTMIASNVADFSTARKFVNAIFSNPNDQEMIQCLNDILSKSSGRFAGACNIGALPPFGLINDMNGNDMNGSFTFSFWLRNDQSVLSGGTAFSHIATMKDSKGNLFSLSLVNNTPFAILDDQRRTLVSLCQRMTSNKWTHFAVVFRNKDSGLISTVKDGEPIHDSEFRPVRMVPGKLEVEFGGYTFDRRRERYEGLLAGKIAKFAMFNRVLRMEEIEGIFLRDEIPSDYLFYLASSRSVKRNGKNIRLQPNIYSDMSMIDAILQSPTNVRRLFSAFGESGNPVLLSILARVLAESKDESLVAEVATMLFKMKRDYRLYLMLFKLIRGIKNHNTRFVWFEDILINVDLWDVSDSRIVSHWTSLLTREEFTPFFIDRVRFPHFNPFLYFLLKIEDPNPQAIFLLKSIGRMHEFKDTNSLLYAILRNRDNDQKVCIYLSILRDVAIGDRIIQAHRKKCLYVLQFLDSGNPDVVVVAVEALASILGGDFFSLIPTILKKIQVTESLVRRFEASSDSFSSIFALVCAISLSNPGIKIGTVPQSALLKPKWYLYPTLLYARSEDPLRDDLAGYLSRGGINDPESLPRIMFLLISLMKFSAHTNFDACRHLLERLTADAGSREQKVSILWSLLSVVLFNLQIGKESEKSPLFTEYETSAYSAEKPETVEKVSEDAIPVTDILSLKKFLDDKVSASELHFRVRIEGKALSDLEMIDRARKLSHDLDQTSVAKILDKKLEGRDVTLALSDFKRGHLVDQSHFGRMTDVLYLVSQEIKKRFMEWKKVQSTVEIESLCRDYEWTEPEEVTITGRIDGKINVQREIQVLRSGLLSHRCPYNVTRRKITPTIPRLFAPPTNAQSNASLIVFTHRDPVFITLTDEKDCIRIKSSASDKVYEIRLNTIARVLFVGSDSLAIITRGGRQYLIDCKPEKNKEIMELIESQKQRLPNLRIAGTSPTNLKMYVDKYLQLWKKREITSFKYLCVLNELSGRTYHDMNHYPVFPSVDSNFDTVTDTSLPLPSRSMFATSELTDPIQFSNRLLVLPEHYYFAESCGPIETIYENRKKLEQLENLNVWIDRVFGSDDFFVDQLFTSPHPPRDPKTASDNEGRVAQVNFLDLERSSNLIFAHPLKSKLPKFVCVDENGYVFFVTTVTIEQGIYEAEVSPSSQVFSDIAEYRFFGTRTGLVACNGKSIVVVHEKLEPKRILFFPSKFWFSDGVCQDSPTTLLRFTASQGVGERLSRLPERICCLASSEVFHIVVAGCEDGKVRIRSTGSKIATQRTVQNLPLKNCQPTNGSKVATVDLDGEIPISIIITESWGFVVVKTFTSLFVFTVNGTLAKKVPHAKAILHWTTFTNRDGLDFIAYLDAEGIHVVEVMNPENVTDVAGFLPDVISLEFVKSLHRLAAVCRSRKTMLILVD